MAAVVGEDVSEESAVQSADASADEARTLRQRIEASTAGRVVISVGVVVFLLLNVVWNLPQTSPISEGLHTLADPVAVPMGLDQWWGMFAVPETRVVSVEVDVKMADGEIRVWHLEPGAPGVGWWSRWTGLRNQVVKNQFVRPQLAHWAVGQVTKPGEHATDVAVVLRSENLSKPGEPAAGKAPASKILYQESLAGPR